MVTEISPIFGLSLLELLEVATIAIPFAIAGSAIVTGFFSWRSIQQSNKQVTEQMKSQHKVSSATLIDNLLETWRVDTPFTRTLDKLSDPNAEFEEERVYEVLDEYESLAVLYVDETLDKNHVRQFFGRGIVQINANHQIKKILSDYNNDDPNNNYTNLMILLTDSEKWRMKP